MPGSLSSEIDPQSCEHGHRGIATLHGGRAFDRAAPVGEA
jgi:hypothetical protein